MGFSQQDLAPCHTSKKMRTFFEENGLTTLDWPGNSPDLNPIENLWAIIKLEECQGGLFDNGEANKCNNSDLVP